MEKGNKPFFFRIDAADLMDFATDPEGEGMTLLRFAKELQKGKSDIAFIQDIITEAVEYIDKKKKAGSRGGLAKASSAKAVLKHTPSQSSSSSSSSTVTETEEDLKRVGIASDKPKRTSTQKMTDEEWIASLKASPAYQGLNIEVLKAKMEAWCDLKGKKPTRARFLNWLNREEKPMASTRQRLDWDALIREARDRDNEC